METLAGFRANLAKSEGNVPFMYLDAKRLVTVGIGHRTPKEALASIKFVKKDNPTVEATITEKNAEFDAVSKSTTPRYITGEENEWYKKNITLLVEEATISSLFDNDLAIKERELMGIHPNKHDYSVDVWFAMLDIIFNTGGGKYATENKPATGLRKFSNFNNAIRCRKFDIAAKESHRASPISEERNNYVKQLLLTAARDEALHTKKNVAAQCTVQPAEAKKSKAVLPDQQDKAKSVHTDHKSNAHKRQAKINRPSINSGKTLQRPVGTSIMNSVTPFKHPLLAPNGHGLNTDQTGSNRH